MDEGMGVWGKGGGTAATPPCLARTRQLLVRAGRQLSYSTSVHSSGIDLIRHIFHTPSYSFRKITLGVWIKLFLRVQHHHMSKSCNKPVQYIHHKSHKDRSNNRFINII